MYTIYKHIFYFLLGLSILSMFLWHLEPTFFSKENGAVEQFSMTNPQKRKLEESDNYTKPWLIVYWSTYFGQDLKIQLFWKTGECPVPCEVTSDRSRASEANGFIVHARDSEMTPPSESVPWILYTQENPVYTPVLRNAKFMSKFKMLSSYRLDSDFPDPSYTMPELTAPIPFKKKTGFIFAVFSHCEDVRTEYLKQLMQFVQVDSYGKCLRNKKDLVERYGSVKGKNFKQLKTELARKYKFTLVFFNQDCDYFVDDQLSHALDAGSVPVVMGTDKLDEFLPGNLQDSVIKVRDFKNAKLLAEHLKNVNNNETEYNKYLGWKWKGIGNISGTVIGSHWKQTYPLYCQMCVALSEGRIHNEGLKIDNCTARTFEDWGITSGSYSFRLSKGADVWGWPMLFYSSHFVTNWFYR